MTFTPEVKAELLAFVQGIDPVDTAPLIARIVELETALAEALGKIEAAKAALE